MTADLNNPSCDPATCIMISKVYSPAYGASSAFCTTHHQPYFWDGELLDFDGGPKMGQEDGRAGRGEETMTIEDEKTRKIREALQSDFELVLDTGTITHVDYGARAVTVQPKIDGQTSDGYHTFDDLYDHRMTLTAALLAAMPGPWVWRSKQHHPDGDPMFDGFFVVGCTLPKQGQVSYHYKLEHWDFFKGVPEVDHAPLWDGHTPEDVVARLKAWVDGQ